MTEPTIKAKLILDTSGGGLGAAAAGGDGGLGGSGVAGSMKGLGKSMGAMAKTLGVLLSVIQAFKAPLLMLAQIASLLLMFLKPLSDVAVFFLKPFIMILAKLLIPFLRAWNNIVKKTDLKEKVGDVGKATIDAINPAVGLTSTAKTIVEKFEESKPIFAKIKEKIIEWAIAGWDGAKTAWEWISEKFLEWAQAGWDAAGTAYDWITGPFLEWVNEKWEDANSLYVEVTTPVFDWINKKWDDAKSLFLEVTEPVTKWITDKWEAIEDFSSMVWNAVKTWLAGAKDKIVGLVMGMIPDFLKNIVSKGGNKNDNETPVKDALITSDGRVITFDPNDDIMASKNGFKGMGGGNPINITVNINALDASSISSSLITQITNKITEVIKRETLGRSSYGVGA
jgi:hypothetical protein